MSLTFFAIGGILISFFLTHILSKVNPFLLQFINLYSILVIFVALKRFNPSSILVSASVGILEDINTFFPVGVNALKKLVLLFCVNRISKLISVSSFFGYLILIFLAVSLELLVLILITAFFGLRNPLGGLKELLFLQPLLTSLLGSPLFVSFSKIIKE